MRSTLSSSFAIALVTLVSFFAACGGGGKNGATGGGSSSGGSSSTAGSSTGGGSTSGGSAGGDDGSVTQGDDGSIVTAGGDGGPPGQPGPTLPPPPANNRVLYNFDYGWKFIKMDVAGASAPTFDDSTWTDVSLPHTYNDVDTFVDWVAFATDTPIMPIWQGPTWYRKHFTLDSSYQGRKVFLEFQGIRNVGTFYVNGQSLGFCEDQISPCGIDITSAANFGSDNVIAVQVNNNDLEKDQTYVPGYVFDWSTQAFYPMYGGLYTDANLIVTDLIHQTLPLYRNLQTSGVYVYSSNVDTLNKNATANVEAEVYNESTASQMVTLKVDIYDYSGNDVLTQTGMPQAVAAGQKATLTWSAPMTGVHFWAPDYPYLYTARTSISVGGNVLDVVDNTLGIRTFTWNTTNGFKINGHSIWLAGFSPREVMDWSGPGIPQDWMTEYDYTLWKQANAFFIRPMHVAPRRHMVDSADRMGMIMVVPAGDSEGCPPGQPQPGIDWPQHTNVMQNVMIYYRNDPSVAFYEGCNEALSTMQIDQMKSIRDQWDPHGGRYMGARDVNPAIPYEYGSPMDWAARSTTIPFWAAEYSREEAPRRVWDKYTPAWDPTSMAYVTGGYVNIASPYYRSPVSCPGGIETTMGNCICEYPLLDFRTNSMEDQALDNVYDYWQGYSYTTFVQDAATSTKYGVQIGGSKIFFADSDSDGRMHDTEVARVSGAVDGSRLPKEAFYAMKVAASLTPDIALLGHWNYPAGTTKTVYVVATCGTGATTPSTVTLGTYDGTGTTLIKSYTGAIAPGGAYPAADSPPGSPNHYVWSFPNVAYQPGMIKAAATCGSTTVTDQKVTAGAPAALKLTPLLGPKGWFADGADIAMVDFEVVDSNGLRVPTDEANVNFTYSGDGVWIGGYNSGVRLSKFKPNLWTEGGINRLFVRSTTTAGTYTITATRPGLSPATITLTSTPFPVDSTGLTQNWSQRYDVTLGPEPTPVADE